MDILSFCKNADILLSPFISLLTFVNTYILVAGYVKDRFFTDDNFFIKVTKYGNISFYNKGKYPVTIKEVSFWADDNAEKAPKIEDLLSKEVKVSGRDKRNFHISFNTKEFAEMRKQNYTAIYLCLDIESDSGSVYDQLAYTLVDKKGVLRFCKYKLNKELNCIE